MILYNSKNPDGVWPVTYKENEIDSQHKDTLHNYDECKIVRVLQGAGIWHINGEDVDFKQDDVFVFSRLDFRHIKQSTEKVKIEQVNFLPNSLGVFGGCTEIFFSRQEGFCNKIARKQIQKEICACFEHLREYTFDKCGQFRDEIILNTVIRMALLTARAYSSGNKRRETAKDSFSASVMRYVTENLDADLSLGSVAKKFGFSPAYFSQAVKKSIGMSFGDYVATRRINRIILELNKTNENILDIAMRFGFRSSSGFYKTFSRITGSSPKNFRLD